MIENLIPKDERRELSKSYKLRSGFWATSIVAHIVWIFIATQIHLTPKPLRPIYDEFIRPLERKVLVYRPPKKTAAATPETRVGSTIDPRGAAKALRAIIATAPQAKSQKQMIIRPLPELKVDVPAPNIVARVETALPPPPPKVQAKRFTAPVPSQRTVVRNTDITATALPAAPTVADALNNPLPSNALLPPAPKIAPKQFTPPPASARQPKLATPTEVSVTVAAAQPVTAATGGLAISTSVLPPAPKTPPKQFKAPVSSGGSQRSAAKDPEITASVATAPTVSAAAAGPLIPSVANPRLSGPPREVPPAPEPTRGNDQANIAIANVNPNPSAAIPAGSRPGQFSVAPTVGEPSSGAAGRSDLVVPNLAVRDPAVPKVDPAKSNTVIYAEKVRSSATGAFAVPLRPSNRSIPRAVDARFPGRSVYTVLIPIENLPAYGADWILWFAEVAPLAGQTPSVKGPIPFRKIELVEKNRESTDTRLQIAATLGADGKLSNLKMLSNVSASTTELALEDMGSWEWKPATRNGVAIAVEAVFEIPFRLPKRP